MIFYFSGTGNSLFAAKTLAHDGEEVISMIDAVRSKAFRCTLKENEPLGFVFPVYFYTVSDPVLELVRNLTVENASFVYAVIPCGASMVAGADFCARKIGSFIMGLIMACTSYPSWQSGRSSASDKPRGFIRPLIVLQKQKISYSTTSGETPPVFHNGAKPHCFQS